MQSRKLFSAHGLALAAQDEQRGDVAPDVAHEDGDHRDEQRRENALRARRRRVDVAVADLRGADCAFGRGKGFLSDRERGKRIKLVTSGGKGKRLLNLRKAR